MGKLLALELYNFKSYKGHHVLQFGDSYFTSIIGPNGSGKSNSMDAISFVLGIKSSHLRSQHLKDLVYRGRVLKHSKINADGTATDDAQNGHTNGDVNGDAEQGADEDDMEDGTQTSSRNDPQTAWVMAVYEDDAGEEQRWKRSITSNGQSEYRINNRIVSAKAYNESLEAENILIKARNFLVFQGDVEAIAAQSPKDLTNLIEQISGSLDYKKDYERLKVEKEQADEEQAYKLTQRRGINGEIKQYREQKDELDKYEQTRDEKDAAVTTHILWKLFHFQRTIEDSTAEIQKHQAELKEFRRNVQKYSDRLEAVKADQAKVGREVNKCEREIKRKGKEAEEKENELVPVDEKLSISTANLEKFKSRIQGITKERDEQRQMADKLQKDLDKVQTAQQRWEKEWRAQQQKAGRALNDQDRKELENLRKEVYKRTGNDQNKIDTITRQLRTDEGTVASLKSSLDRMETIDATLREEVANLKAGRDETKRTIKSLGKDIEAKKVAINALISDRDRTEQKRRELDEKLQQVLLKLAEADGYQRETRKETELRELVGQLKRIYPGVRGILGHLCKPKQKKYETAVSTVLGRHFDSIVVDSEKTARDCIQYLKDQKTSHITFIPLDTVIHKPANANLRGLHQGTRLAIDTIDYDTNYERAMSYACGNAIVTDTLTIAKNLIYSRKVDAKAVTLDGTVIHKGGNMTGGEGFDKKRRFEDAEVDNLRKLATKLRDEIEALPKGHKRQVEEEQLRSDLSGLEARRKQAEDEHNALVANIESKAKELKHVESQVAEMRPRYRDQSQGVDTLRQSLEEHTETVAEVEDEVFGTFCQRLGYDSIRDYEQQQGALQEEADKKKDEFARQVSRLSNQLEFEKQKIQSTQNRLKSIEASSKRDEDMVAALEAQKQEISSVLEELNGEVEELNSNLDEFKKDFEVRGEKVQEARRELQKRSKGEEKTVREITDLESEVSKAANGRFVTLRDCKVRNVELPLEQGSRKIDSLPMDDQGLEDDQNAMDIDGNEGASAFKFNDYGIRIDFDELDDDLKEGGEEDEEPLIDKINNLQSALDKMAPNMRSAERLEATSARLAATDKEFNDSRSAAKAANKAFEEMRQKRMDLFNKAFTHISEQIGPVYRELTKTQSFPLGGSASLDVEDEDEPYLSGVKYHAMPPLKRFRDMEHLSGGEKTMAALALLFAVHTYAPSPFFVLDEVDAALDHANTTQLAQYVREHAGPGMQFVVISLKTGLFQNSETLVGIMRDQAVNSSRALTLDGFDLSTQQLKGIVVDSNLKLVYEAKVDFDRDLKKYGIEKGVLTNPSEGEVFAPPAMWLEAVDLVLDELKKGGLNFSLVKGISGAGMQHGTVFWSEDAEALLSSLDASKRLVDQLEPGSKGERRGAFAHPMSPNWQDASTQQQCDAFDVELGDPETLARVTGSKAHHRFSGPQILRYRTKYPSHYEQTARISLVSSFLATVFLGKIAPIDISDVTGMNLWDINRGVWHDQLLALAAGSSEAVPELKKKLGHVPEDGGEALGAISRYFVGRYGFAEDCKIIPFTGDNPSTILALPLRPSDAMVSLGTSTTFLMSTPEYRPDPAYHFMNHPTTAGLYMFMLCYKNGGLAREQIRDTLRGQPTSSWDQFNDTATSTPPLSQKSDTGEMRMGLYFPRPEIVPNLPSGQWRYSYDPEKDELSNAPSELIADDARNIIESQMLSLRLRSHSLVKPEQDPRTGEQLPAQPRRVYLVGGGSANPAIAKICGEVLGSVEGVYKLDIGGNACALGGAYKAVWGCERKAGQTFESLISDRWDEDAFVKRIAEGYTKGVFEKYGEAVRGFDQMEKLALKQQSKQK
ncbi:structural maintenance of chromosomes 1 [Lecanosticta acicola]|uniref:xylulokinase n=1 Tax=Lecanosticta acicola TaxID=111012 RepID=A0AAI9EB64_9PEZI|nr:structural maintenance of chromosomes 1 [Lecanosticta acicola]